jgi:phospholipase C
VPPTDAPAAGVVNKHRFAFDRLGPRVPALIISPLIPKNLIDHRVYDHATVPATIEHQLELDPLTERDRHANSLYPLIQPTPARTDAPARLQTPASITAPRTVATSAAQASAPNRSIDENQIAAFVYAAYAQDIELSDPSQHPAIRARVAAIRTHQHALDYMRDVAARASTARKAQAARMPDRAAS